MDLSTAFLPNEMSRVHRIVSLLKAEKLFAQLPTRLRYKLAKRRSPLFHLAQVFMLPEASDNELHTQIRMNCIFVHIPKVAGTSISRSLFGTSAGGHLPLHYYLWLFGAHRFDQMFKFSVVRHPVSRAISAYNFLKSGGLNSNDREWAKKYVMPYSSFDAFVQESLIQESVQSGLHLRPQMFFLTDPRTGRIGLDFVGRFETLQNDYLSISDHLGLNCSLQHLNSGLTNHNQYEIAPVTRKLLEEIYRDDYEALGY